MPASNLHLLLVLAKPAVDLARVAVVSSVTLDIRITHVVPKEVATEKAATDRIEQQLRSVLPDGTIERIRVLEYGDDAGVEPGNTALRIFIDRAGRPETGEADLEIVQAFEEAYVAEMRAVLDLLPATVGWVEFVPGGPARSAQPHGPMIRIAVGGVETARPDELTSVMTRLGPADLAVVDTLITAGVATSRAEVMRWALGRIREHPAYAQLQARVREIDELKAQF